MDNIILTDSVILDKFPFEEPRDGQIETVKWIVNQFHDGKKFVILEGPCGCGKSAIAATVSSFFDSVYWLTITKILQDQLSKDFGEHGKHDKLLIDLKGRNAYECTYKPDPMLHNAKSIKKWNETKPHNCADGFCKRKGKSLYSSCLQTKICHYFNQVEKSVASKICLMNFASFLHQTAFTKRFEPRSLLILDEGHNIESQLMNFVSISISDLEFNGLKFPNNYSPQDYAVWLNNNGIIKILTDKLNAARIAEDTRKADELDSVIRKLEHFITEMFKKDHKPWVAEYAKLQNKVNSRVTFKPVFVDNYAHDLLFSWGMSVLIMSATILDVNVMSRSLGIEKKDIAAKRMSSKFPVENRPIFFNPVAKVTGGKRNMPQWSGQLVNEVNKIAKKHTTQRGIIHTHNFYIAEMLIDSCNSDVRRRSLFQKDFRNKTEMLELHSKSPDTIIIAPAMHEGIDLIGELSRFQIICKVPFPNQFEDKQLAARMEEDPQFYEWLTALKLVQSVGRSVRSKNDWAKTYIIDSTFRWWYNKNKRILPGWFKESVIID